MPMEDKPEFHSGQTHFRLQDLQALVRMIPRVITGGSGIFVRMFGDRVVIGMREGPAPPNGGTKIKTFKIVEEKDDYLVCIRSTPGVEDDPETTVNIAKPFLLRKTGFHGETIDYGRGSIKYTYSEIGIRLAEVMSINPADDNVEETDEGTQESQMIVPPYYVGEIITAHQGETGLKDEVNENIGWSDMNTGARTWTHNSRHDPDDPNAE